MVLTIFQYLLPTVPNNGKIQKIQVSKKKCSTNFPCQGNKIFVLFQTFLILVSLQPAQSRSKNMHDRHRIKRELGAKKKRKFSANEKIITCIFKKAD